MVFSIDDLVEVGWYCYVGRVADDLVTDPPFSVWMLLRKIQRPGDHSHAGVALGQVPAKFLEMCPVVSIETLADLGTHVTQHECGVHCVLRPLGICGWCLVASIVAAAEVVVELCTEHGWDCGIFVEHTVASGSIVLRQGLRCEMFGYPVGIARHAVVRGEVGRCDVCVGDERGEAIFENTRWIYWC